MKTAVNSKDLVCYLKEGRGGLGIVVCNHASTFSSIHCGVQATQTTINTRQIRDCVCVCIFMCVRWELMVLRLRELEKSYLPTCVD